VPKIVRVIRPSRSNPRSVSVSMRCEMPPISRFNSLKRMGRAPKRLTMSTDHLSPIRARTPLMARQSPVSRMLSCFICVPSCALSR